MKYLVHGGHSARIITTMHSPQGMYFHPHFTDKKPEHSGDSEARHMAVPVVS